MSFHILQIVWIPQLVYVSFPVGDTFSELKTIGHATGLCRRKPKHLERSLVQWCCSEMQHWAAEVQDSASLDQVNSWKRSETYSNRLHLVCIHLLVNLSIPMCVCLCANQMQYTELSGQLHLWPYNLQRHWSEVRCQNTDIFLLILKWVTVNEHTHIFDSVVSTSTKMKYSEWNMLMSLTV